MAHILVHEKVKDFASWKATFDSNAEMRSNAGSTGGLVLQSADDPNEVVILLEWEDLDRAREFAASAGLKEAMERAGVVGDAHIHVLEQAAEPSA